MLGSISQKAMKFDRAGLTRKVTDSEILETDGLTTTKDLAVQSSNLKDLGDLYCLKLITFRNCFTCQNILQQPKLNIKLSLDSC